MTRRGRVKIFLQPLSPDLLTRMRDDPATALTGMATVSPGNVSWLKSTSAMALDFYRRAGAVQPWTGYLTINQETREAVGTCGFKGKPNAEGVVEIAYGTFNDFENRGVATAVARQLTMIARQDSAVKKVIAHTLAQRNASGRVLEKAGFQFAGEVIDPEDGRVWRWECKGT